MDYSTAKLIIHWICYTESPIYKSTNFQACSSPAGDLRQHVSLTGNL